MGRGLGRFWAFVEPRGERGAVAHSTARLFTEVPVLVHVKAMLATKRNWSAQPGTLTLSGSVHLLGLKAEILFRKSHDHDPSPGREDRDTATIVTAGHAIPIPSQRVPLMTGPGTELWMRVADPGHQPPWTEHFMGRCDGRPLAIERDMVAHGILDASFHPEAFADGQRTRVEMAGELRFERPLLVRLLTSDAGEAPAEPAQPQAGEVVVMPGGTSVPIGRQAMWGLVGPNPWVSLRILDAGRRMVGEEHPLGRSVRMN